MKIFDQAGILFRKSVEGQIMEEDLDTVISWPDDQISVLFACADQVKRQFLRNSVDPCTLMNVKSGGCSEDCAFCSQSAHHNTNVEVRDLAESHEIIAQCKRAQELGVSFCVVSSGKQLSYAEVGRIAGALKQCGGEKHASLGILGKQEFALLRDAGVVCYNHNLETSRTYFPSIVTTHTYDERVATVKLAKESGMKVCCGGIFGLGESWSDRKEFCFELKNLKVDTVPINFLNAIEGTRVSKPAETPLEFLKIVSMFRLALPSTTIKVCGGREDNLGMLQSMIFHAGANGYVTGGYLTTGGAGIDTDEKMIQALGLKKKLV